VNQRFNSIATLLLASIAISACSSSKPKMNIGEIAQPGIGYYDGAYRVCRENCPTRTPKELADSMLMTAPVIRGRPSVAFPVKPAPGSVPAENTASTVHANANQQPAAGKKIVREFDVYFGFGKSTPTRAGKKTLALIALEAKKSSAELLLIGSTDDIGPQALNDRLALRRASYVARWLKSKGVTGIVSVESHGKCCHPTPYDKDAAATKKMRRVTARVTLFNQPERKPENDTKNESIH